MCTYSSRREPMLYRRCSQKVFPCSLPASSHSSALFLNVCDVLVMDARWVGGKGICHHQPETSHPGAAQKGSTSTEQQSVCSQNWPWPAVAYSLHLYPDPSKCEKRKSIFFLVSNSYFHVFYISMLQMHQGGSNNF